MELAGARTVGICATLLSVGLIMFSEHVAEEIVFPANAAYSVLTFFFTYSDSSLVRHYVFSFLLSFSELVWVSLLKYFKLKGLTECGNFKPDFFLLYVEFLVVFVAIRMMGKKDIYLEFKNDVLRTPVFVARGYFKARMLVVSLRVITIDSTLQITQMDFLTGVVFSGLLAALPAVIYVIDKFLCCDVSVRDINFDGIYTLGKTAVVVVGASIVVELFVLAHFEILIGFSVSALVIYLYYLLFYSFEAYRYSKNFTIKVD